MVDVSIIYVNYNTEAMIVASVKSLFKYIKGISFEVIIVDNNSREQSLARLRLELSQYEMVHFVSMPENVGFGRANNAALSLARGNYLFLLNPDTLLLNDAVSVMKDYMDIEASVASCCGNLFGADMAPVTSFHRLFPSIKGELNNLLLFLPERIRYGRNRFFNFTNRPLSVAAGTGADLMIRKAVVDKIGLFDDRFFMYYEDVELCHRIRAHGYDIVNVPGAQIQHLEGRSSSNMQLKADFVFKGRETFYLAVEKGKRYRRICNMIFSLYCCLRCFLGVFQGKASRQFWLRMVHNCIMSKYIL